MINLTPKEEKKENPKRFLLSVDSLALFTFGFAMIIVSIAIVPSYILSSVKNNIVNQKIETQKNEPVPIPDQATVNIIKATNNKLNIIERAQKTEASKQNFSTRIIDSIISEKLPVIKINNISYSNDPSTGEKIIIQGVAPSREDLLPFRLALENNKAFKQVDLPISNFVQDTNIKFFLNLIPS